MFVSHPLIKPRSLDDRKYQRDLASVCSRSSTLLVLPTGLGKTVVAARVAADVLMDGERKVLFLAPTKPLVEQHARFLADHLTETRIAQVTGERRPDARAVLWRENRVIVSTPQAVANDLAQGRIGLGEVGLIIYDEAHRGVGNYAYTAIASAYGRGRLALGMTASPGSSRKRISNICENLGLENLELRTDDDPDIADHAFGIETEWVEIDVPDDMAEAAEHIRVFFDQQVSTLIGMGLMKPDRPPTLMYLLEVNRSLQARLRKSKKNGFIFRALSLQAMALKAAHALELAETQGPAALGSYLNKLKKEAASKSGSRAARTIVGSPEFAAVDALLGASGQAHPKMERMAAIVEERLRAEEGSRIIVFTNYRDSCEAVVSRLSSLNGARVSRLVGQADHGEDPGLNQAEQVEVLSRLRRGDLNIVVATCIGEEGLDVADTDLVVFYEPVPSEIRSIQRRGRTGRTGPGKVVILVTRGTKDVVSLASSELKEAKMVRNVVNIKRAMERRKGEGGGRMDELPRESAEQTA